MAQIIVLDAFVASEIGLQEAHRKQVFAVDLAQLEDCWVAEVEAVDAVAHWGIVGHLVRSYVPAQVRNLVGDWIEMGEERMQQRLMGTAVASIPGARIAVLEV